MLPLSWKLTAGAAVLSLMIGFGSGYQVRDWIAAEADAERADANTQALADELERTRIRAQEAAQRELEASMRADALQSQNALLRASLTERAVNVEISDPCSQCRLGSDAVSVLLDAASGRSGAVEPSGGTGTDPKRTPD